MSMNCKPSYKGRLCGFTTCKDILTQVNAFGSFADTTSTNVKKPFKNIWMPIMETHPVSTTTIKLSDTGHHGQKHIEKSCIVKYLSGFARTRWPMVTKLDS